MTAEPNGSAYGPWPQERVRFGRMTDLDELMELCRNLANENAIAPMMDSLVQDTLEGCLSHKSGFVGVIGEPGKIEGAMCLVFNSLWYCNSYWWLEDKFLHVLPEYRASNNAAELIEWSQWWSSNLGIPLMLGIVSNERTRAKIKLYERKLGPMSGALFLVGAKTGLEGTSV
jgi:hypothetical protein